MRCHDGVNREEMVLAGPVLGHNGAPRRDEEVASFLYEGSLSVGQRMFANAILGDVFGLILGVGEAASVLVYSDSTLSW